MAKRRRARPLPPVTVLRGGPCDGIPVHAGPRWAAFTAPGGLPSVYAFLPGVVAATIRELAPAAGRAECDAALGAVEAMGRRRGVATLADELPVYRRALLTLVADGGPDLDTVVGRVDDHWISFVWGLSRVPDEGLWYGSGGWSRYRRNADGVFEFADSVTDAEVTTDRGWFGVLPLSTLPKVADEISDWMYTQLFESKLLNAHRLRQFMAPLELDDSPGQAGA